GLPASAYPECPKFNDGFKVFQEGDVPGSTPSSALWFATSQNGLFRVERMDNPGLGVTDIVRDARATAVDPDYSPVQNKLVFVSTRSGNYEIWLANPDGSDARQVTRGFGSTERGIFARHPHWAPNGQGIVFESN